MNINVVTGVIYLAQTTLQWLMLRNGGDRAGAVELLTAMDLSGFGLDDKVLDTVNLGRASINWLDRRGVPVGETIALLELAAEEDRDVTHEEVVDLIDTAQAELDETQNLIDQLPE